jgi:signal transduction histidine kinase
MSLGSLVENITDRRTQAVRDLLLVDEREIEVKIVHVLMVEDDKHYCTFIRRLLSKCEQPIFELTVASSIAEASQCLSWETPDVILLDLGLPDSNGLETIENIKQLARDIPIIILTGWNNEKSGLQAVALGAQDYLVKHEIANDSLSRSIRYVIERRKSEGEILRSAVIKDFTSMLAHDLKVPLIGADSVFEALLLGQFGQLPNEQATVLSELQKSNKDQLALVESLLEVYRFEASAAELQFKPVDIKTLILRCINDVSMKFLEAPTIVTIVPDGLPAVFGEQSALYRLFMNLLDNAIKFSNGMDQVTVHTELVGTKLAIHVHNKGNSIPPEVQAELFQKFWRGVPGKSYVANTGLGLYFCNRIVSLHRGRITCQSTREGGTTIRVILPVVGKK